MSAFCLLFWHSVPFPHSLFLRFARFDVGAEWVCKNIYFVKFISVSATVKVFAFCIHSFHLLIHSLFIANTFSPRIYYCFFSFSILPPHLFLTRLNFPNLLGNHR